MTRPQQRFVIGSYEALAEQLDQVTGERHKFERDAYAALAKRIDAYEKATAVNRAAQCQKGTDAGDLLDYATRTIWLILYPEPFTDKGLLVSRFIYTVLEIRVTQVLRRGMTKLLQELPIHADDLLSELRTQMVPWILNPQLRCFA